VPGEYRTYQVLRRHPMLLSRFAAEHVEACLQAARAGWRSLRRDLGRELPPEVVEAAMAAYEQGSEKFWAMHDKFFEKQNELSPAYYEKVAGEIGLDVPKWKAAVEAHRSVTAIQADMSAGNAVGANGTPTFFINGRRLVGAMPFESFKAIIDAELASKVAKK